MYEELVKSLREAERVTNGRIALWGQAADAIEELSKEVDALKHDIERYVQINTDLTTELEHYKTAYRERQDKDYQRYKQRKIYGDAFTGPVPPKEETK